MKLSQRGAGILATGIFTSIGLFTLWVPFLIFLGFPLIQAMIKEGICNFYWGVGQVLPNVLNTLETILTQAYSDKREDIHTYFSALKQSLNKPPKYSYSTETVAHNQLVEVGMWITLVLAWLLGGYGIYKILLFYRIPVGTFMLRNIMAAIGIAIIELSLFGGVAMLYLPWDWNEITQTVIGHYSS